VSERRFTSKQWKKVIYGRVKHGNRRNKQQNNRKVKGEKTRKVRERRDGAATLSDLYPSTCLAWLALTGV